MGEKKKIAVICASPPGINPGMSSVDLAFMYLSTKYKFSDRVTLYQLYPPPKYNNMSNPENQLLQYSIIPDDDDFFISQDLIIYWGDFLHMSQYHETVAKVLLLKNRALNLESAKIRVHEVFLLKGQNKEVFQKSFSFGSTILFNTMLDEMQVDYKLAIEHFLKYAGGVWFRDVFSALKACHIRGIYHPSCQGVDCATLHDPNYLTGSEIVTGNNKQIGIFIGRTLNYITEIIAFANELASRIGYKPTWLNWGDINAFPNLVKVREVLIDNPIEMFNDDGILDPENALKSILKCDLIITDTYHICVNAWNLGIPAICFYGDDDVNKKRDVNSGNAFAKRDKRQVFMSMYDGLDFLVLYSELNNINFRKERLDLIVTRLKTKSEITAIHNRLRQHAIQSERMFVNAISQYF